MTFKLKLKPKTYYGKTLFYPENSDAELFCTLTKQKALTKDQVMLLRTDGRTEIELVTEESDWLEAAKDILGGES